MKTRRPEQGSVMVEAAFVLPFLGLFLLIIVDLGLVIREHQLLQNGAREGARFSSLPANQVSPINPNATIARIQNFVVAYLQQEGITIAASNVTVNQNYAIPVSGGVTARGSEITVVYPRQFLILGRPILPPGPVTLRGRSVFRNLY